MARGSAISRALDAMKGIAARFIGTSAADVISGPAGTVSREAIRQALNAAGPRVTLFTKLTQPPLAGRELFTATERAATDAARAVGQYYSAQLPRALIVILEKAGLVAVKRTMMRGKMMEEYHFLAQVSEFIAPLFR